MKNSEFIKVLKIDVDIKRFSYNKPFTKFAKQLRNERDETYRKYKALAMNTDIPTPQCQS